MLSPTTSEGQVPRQAPDKDNHGADGDQDDGADNINNLLKVRSKPRSRRRSKGRRKPVQEPDSDVLSPETLGVADTLENLEAGGHSEPLEPPEGLTDDHDPSTATKEESSDEDEGDHNPFDSLGYWNQVAPGEGIRESSSMTPKTLAKDLWEDMKQRGEKSDALDRLMFLVGLEDVKMQFLKVKATIEAARRRKGWLRRLDLNMAFMGNPGTGKTTVAKIYHEFLLESKVWPEGCYSDIIIGDEVDQGDDWQFPSRANRDIDDNQVIIVTGSVIGVSKLLESRPQGRWECWRRVRLPDFDDEELRVILLRLIELNNLQVDGGPESPYPLILAKRVGRGRNKDGFGNIHELLLAFEQTLERHAHRLKLGNSGSSTKAKSSKSSKRVLTMEDIMGSEPAELWAESAAWKELDSMAGLEDVKKAVRSLMRRSKINYRRELQGKEPLQISLNGLFLGPPGTGKTTVAKLYARILGELGLLSSKEVICTTPSDFIGTYAGETESRVSSLIESAAGKVLIIDDAHAFYPRDENSFMSDDLDSFRRSAVDTLVSLIDNRPGEDCSVILVGYADKMEEMFRKYTPGLNRRFPLEEAFRFHDYDDQQLNKILRIKMAKEEVTGSKKAMDVAAEVLRRARDRPNFGNGGDIDNLLNQAKARFRERKAAEQGGGRDPFEEEEEAEGQATTLVALEPQDFDPNWDRGINRPNDNLTSSLFSGLLGFDDIRKQFEGYQLMAFNMRLRGKDPRESIPFTYVFTGPPGTGKTCTARIMGQLFYHMGFLSTDEVIECSASHMVGRYTGQSAPKVVSLLESALGKVLFIDEAYRLTSSRGGDGDGQLESEAIGELVDCMTKPRYLRKMIIVLAGYNEDMSLLLKSNAGLRGRFPTEIRFKPMGEEESRDHLLKLLERQDITIRDEKKVSSEEHEVVLRLFYKLGMTEGWSNGRDIETLANGITAEVYRNVSGPEGDLHISTKELIGFLKDLLRERIKIAR